MANFPALRSGQVAMNGTTQTLAYSTGVVQFVNDAEQRWRGMPKLFRGSLVFTDLNGYDLGLLQEFFRSSKGRFDTTWSITIDGQTWNYMAFDQDDFTYTENRPNLFSCTLKVRQVRPN
jgi:DMSO/TMAO reductase YedYZ molybdopterin-dependent catalytic subunit